MTYREFQIPKNDYSCDQTNLSDQSTIRDAVNNVYNHQVNTNEGLINQQTKNESNVNVISEKVYNVADDILKARENHLNYRLSTHDIDKNNFIAAVTKKLFNRNLSPEYIKESFKKDLMSEEAEMGGRIFGKQDNISMSFFCDSRESWFFYQEILNSYRNSQSVTFHYEVRPENIIRVVTDSQTGMTCNSVQGQELQNFVDATQIYHDNVMKMYNYNVSLDKKVA